MSTAISKYPLVDAAAKFCWSKDGQEKFRAFYDKHAPLFVDAPLKENSGEQDLEYWELFQDYLRMYENTMSDYIETLDVGVEEFYSQLADVQEDKGIKDKKLVHFVNYMVACTDYPAFYKMMVRAAKKYNKNLMADAKAAALSGVDVDVGSMGSPTHGSDSKGGKDVDDRDDRDRMSSSKGIPDEGRERNDERSDFKSDYK